MLAPHSFVEEPPQVSSERRTLVQMASTSQAGLGLSSCTCSCRYALTGREVKAILMQRHVKVDGKVRTDPTYPAGFMDVIQIEKTNENFRLVYDPKGRFVPHRISNEEAAYKLCKVKRQQFGKAGVPYIATHDGRTIRYPDPDIKVMIVQALTATHCQRMACKLAANFSFAIDSNESFNEKSSCKDAECHRWQGC